MRGPFRTDSGRNKKVVRFIFFFSLVPGFLKYQEASSEGSPCHELRQILQILRWSKRCGSSRSRGREWFPGLAPTPAWMNQSPLVAPHHMGRIYLGAIFGTDTDFGTRFGSENAVKTRKPRLGTCCNCISGKFTRPEVVSNGLERTHRVW